MESNAPIKEDYESDGLIITIDEEADTITFTWDPELHPKWNFISDAGDEAMVKLLTEKLEQFVAEAETTEGETNA